MAKVTPLRRVAARPQPPEQLLISLSRDQFTPAHDVAEWMRSTFIAPDAILKNDEHAHLRFAKIGVLWTNVPNGRHGRTVIGTCELCPPQVMGKWARARAIQQVLAWFGEMPDFIVTLYAPYCAIADDATFCAICEHELLHAGQDKDGDGMPKFGQDGRPKFTMRGHDVETFVGVARRYGAVEMNVKELVEACAKPPLIGRAELDWACGACMKQAA